MLKLDLKTAYFAMVIMLYVVSGQKRLFTLEIIPA